MTARHLPRHHDERGFTLVELMVALSGGLFLSIMVFALARDTSRFYTRENRVASATLTGMIGFERLKADIARASYLASPNIVRDPKVAVRSLNGWPAMLRVLGGVRINPNTPTPNAALALAENARTPDEIVLSGSYATSDEFPVAALIGNQIFLQPNTPPMARIGYWDTTDNTVRTALLSAVFGANRGLRIVDHRGFQQYAVIESVTGGTNPSITLSDDIVLETQSTGSLTGARGFETGASVSVVNFIRYQVRDLKSEALAAYAPLFAASEPAPGEATRTELVREELDATGTVVSTELVAEYAVDLDFSVTAQMPGTATAISVTSADSSNFQTLFDPSPDETGIGAPQAVRAVRVRLSVRSREADRETAIGGGFYRFKLPDGDFARVRTFQADVALPNQADVRWQ